jgi:hypothetical protein
MIAGDDFLMCLLRTTLGLIITAYLLKGSSDGAKVAALEGSGSMLLQAREKGTFVVRNPMASRVERQCTRKVPYGTCLLLLIDNNFGIRRKYKTSTTVKLRHHRRGCIASEHDYTEALSSQTVNQVNSQFMVQRA